MNDDEAALHDLVNAGVQHQVADRLQDSIWISVEETFIDAEQLLTDFVASLKKSILNDLIAFLIFQTVQGAH